jgi:prepilin peptidase CpaA
MYALSVILPLVSLCSGAAIADIRLRRVPNVFNAALFASGVCMACARSGGAGLIDSLEGAAAGMAFLLLPFLLHMVGGGDVKFLAAAGAIMGLRLIWPAFIAGAAAGGVIALIALVRGSHPFAAISRMLILLETGEWHSPGALNDGQHVTIPYVVPLSVGLVSVAVAHVVSRGVVS